MTNEESNDVIGGDLTDEVERETTVTSLTLRRTIDAPVERVWEAIADREQLTGWFAPGTRRCQIDEWEFGEGGSFSLTFVPSDDDGFGGPSPAFGTFRRIVPERELAMTWNWNFEEESTQSPESRIVFRLRPVDAGTELTFVHEGLPDQQAVDGHVGGWMTTLVKLEVPEGA